MINERSYDGGRGIQEKYEWKRINNRRRINYYDLKFTNFHIQNNYIFNV